MIRTMSARVLDLAPSELITKIAADRLGTPYLALRNDRERLVLRPLEEGSTTIGRAPGTGLLIDWDPGVSRVHAIVEGINGAWFVVDDGMSTNGTLVREKRVHGRRRLADGDVIRVGDTVICFFDPQTAAASETVPSQDGADGIVLTPAQRRVLVALCRPAARRDDGLAVAASNRDIAEALGVSVEAVRSHLKALFAIFAIPELPQHRKRVELASRALGSGVISNADLEET